jgi:demethylmenaquinone methyltransferase/2-methoxy-6-polyprenyl-1,4-benzoquinol methylase
MDKDKPVVPYSDVKGNKKEQVSSMFDRIAPTYDLLNRILSLGIDRSWRRKTVKQLNDIPLDHVLDIAPGTGDIAIEIARQFPETKVLGMDLADHMIDIGRKKTSRENLQSRIQFQRGDSENIPYSDNTFSAVTVAFGVRNFENTSLGLRECYRVLKPQGKFVVLEFSDPKLFPFKQIYRFYFKYILPFIGRITSSDRDAYNYLFRSVDAFPSGKEFVLLLRNAGFQNIRFKELTLGICTIYVALK